MRSCDRLVGGRHRGEGGKLTDAAHEHECRCRCVSPVAPPPPLGNGVAQEDSWPQNVLTTVSWVVMSEEARAPRS